MEDREHALESALRASQAETKAAFRNRALMYAYIFDALSDELGEERATEIMKRAIHRRGLEIGEQYRDAAEAGDLAEVGRRFVGGSPADGSLFEPSVAEPPTTGPDGRERIVLAMEACPLVEVWREAGYSGPRVDLLCDIAASVDFGTFEGAGLELTFLDRQACPGSQRCLLELRARR